MHTFCYLFIYFSGTESVQSPQNFCLARNHDCAIESAKHTQKSLHISFIFIQFLLTK